MEIECEERDFCVPPVNKAQTSLCWAVRVHSTVTVSRAQTDRLEETSASGQAVGRENAKQRFMLLTQN